MRPMHIYSRSLNALYANPKLLKESTTVSELLIGATLHTITAIASKSSPDGRFTVNLDVQEIARMAGLSASRQHAHPSLVPLTRYLGLKCGHGNGGVYVSGSLDSVAESEGFCGHLGIDTRMDVRIPKEVLAELPGRPGILYCFILSRSFHMRDRKVKSRRYVMDSMPGIASKGTIGPALAKLEERNAIRRSKCFFNGSFVECYSVNKLSDLLAKPKDADGDTAARKETLPIDTDQLSYAAQRPYGTGIGDWV